MNELDSFFSGSDGVSPLTGVQRETPQIAPDEAALVENWTRKIRAAKRHFLSVFTRIRNDMQIAREGAKTEWVQNDRYTVPIIAQHINVSVSQLYAKNPKAIATRKPQLDFILWDGKMESLQAAIMQVQQAMPALMAQQAGMMLDPASQMLAAQAQQAQMIVAEVQQVQQKHQMLDKLGKTLEILLEHYLDEQDANFKKQLKQMVRRTKVCGVGYVKLGFQRLMQKQPEVSSSINDLSAQIATIKATAADVKDDRIEPESGRVSELQSMLADLQSKPDVIVREGPVLDFPRATEVIVDPKCRDLDGFVGADWIAHEMIMDPMEVQEIYNVDIGSGFRSYNARRQGGEDEPAPPVESDGASDSPAPRDKRGKACVWQVQSKKTAQVFTIIDGYKAFVEPPHAPTPQLDRFWTIHALMFNKVEDENEIYPPSDVHLLRHPQRDYNTSREGLRLHRRANKPKYMAPAGKLEDQDKEKLQSHPDSALIELQGLLPNEDVGKVLQRFQSVPIDPALYETQSYMDDVQRTVGNDMAGQGAVSGDPTATEVSVAEQNRLGPISSNVDDLDEFLSDFARSMGELMLLELDEQTVKKIAGPGAVWSVLSREQIASEVYLEVKAGSSGRPNKAAELANLERGMPYLIQLPGVPPAPLATKYSELLDLGLEDLIVEGMPSITAMNAIMSKPAAAQPGTGDPATDPGQQGGKGGQNERQPAQGDQGAQPAYPAPAPMAA